MMKNLTLKTLLFPEGCPPNRKPATVARELFPAFDPVTPKSGPDIPGILAKVQKIFLMLLSSCLTRMLPGSFLKQWLKDWRNKIIDDFRHHVYLIDRKAGYFKNAYYQWMEDFMEMDYANGYSEQNPSEQISGGFYFHGHINNYSAKLVNRFGYPVADARSTLVSNLEKALIGFYQFFARGPVMQTPVLEIVNISVSEGEVQENKRKINKIRPKLFMGLVGNRILQKLRDSILKGYFRPLLNVFLLPVTVGGNSPATVGSGYN